MWDRQGMGGLDGDGGCVVLNTTAHRRVLLAAVLLAAPILTGCGAQTAAAPSGQKLTPSALQDGCATIPEPIPESDLHVPFGSQRGQYDSPIQAPGPHSALAQEVSPPTEVADTRLSGIDQSSAKTTYLAYYSNSPPEGLSDSAFYRDEGFMLFVIARDGAPPLYDEIKRIASPERILETRVDDDYAIITWGDPLDERGTRPHDINWSDDQYNYRLSAVAENNELLNAARTLVCDGELEVG